jgi:hypothetical protein
MMQFYKIRHNTAYKRGMPEIYEILSGLREHGRCPECGVSRREPVGDLIVQMGKTKARMWPDVIACGDYPCCVISNRFVSAMRESGIGFILGGTVSFADPLRNGLSLAVSPGYVWVDGARSRAGKMDFEASGFVDVKFCPVCGTRSDDISRTHRRQHDTNPPPGQVFTYDESLGLDLFTTDISPTYFFCTQRVFDCAKKYRLTNISFCRVEEGSHCEPLKY